MHVSLPSCYRLLNKFLKDCYSYFKRAKQSGFEDLSEKEPCRLVPLFNDYILKEACYCRGKLNILPCLPPLTASDNIMKPCSVFLEFQTNHPAVLLNFFFV